jgi:hypothetical protein
VTGLGEFSPFGRVFSFFYLMGLATSWVIFSQTHLVNLLKRHKI